MTDATANNTQIGGVNIEGMSNGTVEIKEVHANTSARDDIIGRDKITVINYYYAERGVAPPAETGQAEPDRTDLPSPYRGLYHFDPADVDIFFGRKHFIQKLIARAKKQGLIAVLGASGSGKSSVVLAGLVPALAREGHWKFTHFRPGDDPFYALATALVPLYEPHRNKTEQLFQARQLADFLRGGFSLGDVLKTIRANNPQDHILLIADQFEELYTLCPDEATRRHFLDSLIGSIQSSASKTAYGRNTPPSLVLVLTMRADFLGQALDYLPLANILENDLKLKPMNRPELTEAIVKPSEKAGALLKPAW
jgi:hypothetical protein